MNSRATAEQLVNARLGAAALDEFPGGLPVTLEAAYATQECAMLLWPDDLAGWKVGRIDPFWSERLGADRLVGPIFAQSIRRATPGAMVEFPIFKSGFAAVEAEFVFRMTSDAPPDKLTWTADEAAQLAPELHVGIETAGSPLAAINDLGPLAVVSDFGNNAGLLLGPQIAGWRERPLASLTCETLIDGMSVGRGGALSLAGGPLAAFAFALRHCAVHGRPLMRGVLVSTGATTGIHTLQIGQQVCVRFDGIAELRGRAAAAAAQISQRRLVSG